MSLARTSPPTVHVRAPAKVNVFFEVGEVQDDGYHDVASAFQAVSLCEEVRASIADEYSVTVTGDVPLGGVPLDDRNLAVRAARLVAGEIGWDRGVRLEIRKAVPVAGGMGGGSADAAAALVAVNELIGAGLAGARLHELAVRLGADVPFALAGGTAVGTGRGDRLSPALARGRFDWVLVSSPEGLSTPDVYRCLDELRAARDIGGARGIPQVDPAVLQALRAGDPLALADALRNDLEPAATALRPSLAETAAEGVALGALAGIVSGSGPTVALLTEDAESAAALRDALAERGRRAHTAHGPVAGARIVA